MSKIGSSGRPQGPHQIQQPEQPQTSNSNPADATATNPAPAAAGGAAAHAQSQIDEQRVAIEAKKKGFLGSLKDDLARKAGNLGVIGQFAAGQVAESASALGDAAVNKAKGKTVVISQIEKK